MKRGPKPKCKECGRKHGEGHYDDCPVGMGVIALPVVEPNARALAQAYALRVWKGQSPTELRSWRVQRVMEALKGQNLPTEGIVLP